MNRSFDPPTPAENARLLAGLRQPPERAAHFLLGQILVRRQARRTQAVRIVETEAYLASGDPAAHVFRGRTPRNEPLWGPPGTIYVFLVYGVHHCLNLAADAAGRPGCVLIRAAEVIEPPGTEQDACSGPGRLCRVLAIDRRLSGRSVFEGRSGLLLREGPPPRRVSVLPRVGIRHAAERRLRFCETASPAVSGPARARLPGVRRSR